ncbi:MAG: hypothetical protein WBX22_32360, partial [Silvibacterium sp.]
VQDQSVWRALNHAGVIVLIETSDAVLQRVAGDFTPLPLEANSTETILSALHLEASAPTEQP